MIISDNIRFSKINLPDFPTGGVIGTAINTVDVCSFFEINQTTSSQTLTLPTPTITNTTLVIKISNIGTRSFVINTVTVDIGQIVTLYYTGSSWKTNAVVQPTDWSILGNLGTNQSTNFLGTTDNIGLSFRTNNTIRQTISNSGNVGINNTNPLVRLVVTDPSGVIAQFGWNATDYIQLVSGGVESRIESTLNRPLKLRVNGADKVNILGTGEIGLNTTVPTSSVHNVGSFAESITVITATTVLTSVHNKIVVNNGATAITITFPDALTCIGRKYVISRYAGSTGVITVQGTGTNQIQAFTGTVGATTTIGAHSAAGAGLAHSFTAVNVGGTGIWVRI